MDKLDICILLSQLMPSSTPCLLRKSSLELPECYLIISSATCLFYSFLLLLFRIFFNVPLLRIPGKTHQTVVVERAGKQSLRSARGGVRRHMPVGTVTAASPPSIGRSVGLRHRLPEQDEVGQSVSACVSQKRPTLGGTLSGSGDLSVWQPRERKTKPRGRKRTAGWTGGRKPPHVAVRRGLGRAHTRKAGGVSLPSESCPRGTSEGDTQAQRLALLVQPWSRRPVGRPSRAGHVTAKVAGPHPRVSVALSELRCELLPRPPGDADSTGPGTAPQ